MARSRNPFGARSSSSFQQNGGGQAPQRREYPGTLCVRVDQFIESMETDPATGEQYPVATAFIGETTASHEKIFMRMTNNDESMRDCNRPVSPRRRDIQQIRTGAGQQAKRGKNGEMENPEQLPVEQRPVFRCDNVLPVTVGGREERSPEGLPMFRTSWITAYCNYQNGATMENMLDHLERDAYSTVNMHFSKTPEGTNYYSVYQNALNSSVARLLGQQPRQFSAEGEDDQKAQDQKWRNSNWASAAYQISKSVTDAWQQCGKSDEPFGVVSVTSWRPEDVIRWTPNDGASDPVEGRKALAAKLTALFSDKMYQPVPYRDERGRTRHYNPSVAPDFVVRYLNEKGEVSSFERINAYFFAQQAKQYEKRAQELEGSGRLEEAAADRATAAKLGTPEGKAEFLAGLLDNLQLDAGETPPVGMDILRGDCCFVTQGITCLGKYGDNPTAARTRGYQAQTLIQLAIEHSFAPYAPRDDIGCSQLFISRSSNRDIVKELHKTKDGAGYREVATLAPNGAKLSFSPEQREQIENEILRLQDFRNIPDIEQKMNAGARQNAAPAAPAGAPAAPAGAPVQPPFAAPSAPDEDGFCDVPGPGATPF